MLNSKEIIVENQAAFLEDLKKIMEIASVKSTAQPGMPFGTGPKEALTATLALAESYGLKTGMIADAVGYAQLGEGAEYIGIVGHLDVVAAGDGWSYPAFSLTEENQRFFGRGILDNKGPILACLYALKLIKEQGLTLCYPIRVIFGTDEESGSHDLPLYLAEEKPPIFGFTPDCKYPVVYGERGIVAYQLTTTFPNGELADLGEICGEQGTAFVPDQLQVTYQTESVEASGQRAPSNAPELGINAIPLLAKKLMTQGVAPALRDYCQWLVASLAEKHHGEGLGMAFSDQDSGKLIVTPYQWQKEEEQLILQLSIRYPVTFSEEDVTKALQNVLPPNTDLTVIRRMPSTNFPKEHMGIGLLSEVYKGVTGLDGTPVTTTGATYARFMPNIVAFGPSFPGQKGIAHNKNEYMESKDLFTNMEIYLEAMLVLANNFEIDGGKKDELGDNSNVAHG